MPHSRSSQILAVGSILLGAVLLLLPLSAAPIAPTALAASAQTEGDRQVSQGTEQENPFEKRAEIEFTKAQSLMRDFKFFSLVLFLAGGLIAVLFCRKYLHTRLPDTPIFNLVIAFFIQYGVLAIANVGLYIICVHYGWLGFDLLNRAVNDASLWPEIQKTMSLGLGSFYIAHLIDAFVVSLLVFALFSVSIALIKGKSR